VSIRIIDTHAHLDMSQFDHDRADAIRRAQDAGVDTIVNVATDLTASRKAIQLAETNPGIYATIGFHPQDARFMKPQDIKEFMELAKNPGVVAVGEIGLDYYRMLSPKETQQKVLNSLLELAAAVHLPVIIHSRDADQDIIPVLRNWTASLNKGTGVEIGVIHCFSGDERKARTFLDMGFYIAFGAYISYPSSRLTEVIRSIPADRLLVETDCPFLPPQTHRGKRNEPSYIPQTVSIIARIREVSFDKIARQTTENACRLFNIK